MKKLNYIDPETLEYVTLNCKLKENSDLRKFYGNIYKAKLDGQFNAQRILAAPYHPGNVIQIFKSLVEENEMEATKLLDCIVKSDNRVSYQTARLSRDFFEMYEYSNEVRIPSDDYIEYAYYCGNHSTFGTDTLKILKEEAERYQQNTLLLNYIGYIPGKEKKESVVKQKVVPFPKENKKVTKQQA